MLEGHRTICSVKYLFGGDFIQARIFGEIIRPLENSEIELARIIEIDTYFFAFLSCLASDYSVLEKNVN